MAEIVNLNRARKAKRRSADAAKADANRVAFGRTKAQRAADDGARQRQIAMLDGVKRDP